MCIYDLITEDKGLGRDTGPQVAQDECRSVNVREEALRCRSGANQKKAALKRVELKRRLLFRSVKL